MTRSVSDELGRIVVDKSGLTGRYDLTLKWTPALGAALALNGESDSPLRPSSPPFRNSLDSNSKPTKGPVSVLVVDHAEMPTENSGRDGEAAPQPSG